MKNNLIIVCLLSSLSLPVCGQSTLDDCIRYAWEHNPGFKNIRIDVKEARTENNKKRPIIGHLICRNSQKQISLASESKMLWKKEQF